MRQLQRKFPLNTVFKRLNDEGLVGWFYSYFGTCVSLIFVVTGTYWNLLAENIEPRKWWSVFRVYCDWRAPYFVIQISLVNFSFFLLISYAVMLYCFSLANSQFVLLLIITRYWRWFIFHFLVGRRFVVFISLTLISIFLYLLLGYRFTFPYFISINNKKILFIHMKQFIMWV